MNSESFESLKKINKNIKSINKKFILLKLIRSAKKEFDNFNYEGCIEECEKILKESSNNSIAYRGLGCSMQMLGNYDKAVFYFEKALNFSDKKEVEYTLLGNLYYKIENFEKALYYYNFAISENEDYESAYEGRNQTILENHLKILDLQDRLIKSELN